MKEILRLIVIPEDQSRFEHEVACFIDWYIDGRLHMTLNGKTPNEVYFSLSPANAQPRFEPRHKWPHGSPCANPLIDIDGSPGDPVLIEIDCHEGRQNLPILRARRAA